MRVLGFPVRIRAGFAVFLLLIVAINGVELGMWLAGSIAVFTLAHELGHALAARHSGSEASISLDFMAGYASFVPSRPLLRRERAAISAAGPLTQIGLGLAVLVAFGANPFDRADVTSSVATIAIWWAGPMIGLFNLIPVLPLDGGNIASEAVDYFAPGRGRSLMAVISIPVTAGAFAYMLVEPNLRPMAAFAGILLVIQLQMRAAERAADRVAFPPTRHPAAMAEDLSWRSDRAHQPHEPFVLSPWWTAYDARRRGDPPAVDPASLHSILEDLRTPTSMQKAWWPPVAASPEQLEQALRTVPRPFPEPTAATSPRSALTLLDVLRRTGHFDEAITYGTKLHSVQPSGDIAIEIARCLALIGKPELAVTWLATAARNPANFDHLRLVMAFLPEFQTLQERRDFLALAETLSPQD